jgi:hypothetical protein
MIKPQMVGRAMPQNISKPVRWYSGKVEFVVENSFGNSKPCSLILNG